MVGIEETAFRSLRREISMGKSNPQVLFDDILCFNAGNGVSGEEFSVDDLLDLSDEHFQEAFHGEEDDEEQPKDSVSVSSHGPLEDESSNSGVSGFEVPLVPVDEWKDLEWVSQFVDDSASASASKFSPAYPVAAVNEKPGTEFENTSTRKVEPPPQWLPRFPTATVPVKPRSKHRRAAARTWSLPSSFSPSLFFYRSAASVRATGFPVTGPPVRKPKRKRGPAAVAGGGSQSQRRCSHCQVQKTPQWRTGPLGAKTLCNACGVRFKSGRLFPEYRPACSPTFSEVVHSNSHRKVLEIRFRNTTVGGDSGSQTPVVPTF